MSFFCLLNACTLQDLKACGEAEEETEWQRLLKATYIAYGSQWKLSTETE